MPAMTSIPACWILATVAGMSGSPIYLDNRLAGAYAYGWPFGKDPVAWLQESTLHFNSLLLMIMLLWAQAGFAMEHARLQHGADEAQQQPRHGRQTGELTPRDHPPDSPGGDVEPLCRLSDGEQADAQDRPPRTAAADRADVSAETRRPPGPRPLGPPRRRRAAVPYGQD